MQDSVNVTQADKFERLKGDDANECSFSCDDAGDGLVLTQHRYYRWGDCIVAVGELNYPNQWDDEAFDAKCAEIETALNTRLSAPSQEVVEVLREAGQALAKVELLSTNHGAWFENDPWGWGQKMGEAARGDKLIPRITDLLTKLGAA